MGLLSVVRVLAKPSSRVGAERVLAHQIEPQERQADQQRDEPHPQHDVGLQRDRAHDQHGIERQQPAAPAPRLGPGRGMDVVDIAAIAEREQEDVAQAQHQERDRAHAEQVLAPGPGRARGDELGIARGILGVAVMRHVIVPVEAGIVQDRRAREEGQHVGHPARLERAVMHQLVHGAEQRIDEEALQQERRHHPPGAAGQKHQPAAGDQQGEMRRPSAPAPCQSDRA